MGRKSHSYHPRLMLASHIFGCGGGWAHPDHGYRECHTCKMTLLGGSVMQQSQSQQQVVQQGKNSSGLLFLFVALGWCWWWLRV